LEAWGFAPEDVLDFSVNGNPYGPPPGVRKALQAVPLDRYPDRDALALRRALSEHLDVSPQRIMAGNGTAELIWLIALAFVRSGDRMLVLEPTFGEYARAVTLMGAQVETWRARPESDFVIEPDQVAQHLQQTQPRLVFLCNPNNPTGAAVSTPIIQAWADDHPGTLFIVDEAYLSFATLGGPPSVLDLRSTSTLEAENVLTLRSMTKDYALAGLRLGYLVAQASVVDALVRVRPPWNVNAMAQAAGVAALEAEDHVQTSIGRLREAKEALMEAMETLRLEPLPSATHFFLLPVDDATTVRQDLLAQRIQVRDCTSFGLPHHVRIATLRPTENARLLEALREVLV
jgi:histidinol-phosphate aminotransferase